MKKMKLQVAKALTKILTPMVRILLRYEISHSEFSEIAKRSYVEGANKYFSIPNRKKTYARVAVLTGLNLKEVRRISTSAEEEMLETRGPINRANQVISGWIRDSDFLDDNKKPKILPLKGETISFEELVSRYSGDITARAILDELLRVGAVIKPDKNTVELVQEAFIPKKSDIEMIDMIARHNSDLMNTGIHNLLHESKDARFQRQVIYTEVPEHIMEEFRLYSSEKSLDLLKDFDRWLAEKTKEVVTDPAKPTGRVGVGVYYFRDDDEGEENDLL